MHNIGIDLAWGERAPTGVAVLDDAGRLVQLGSATDDASILAALQPFADGDCVVAIDAPLVVTNATGTRVAEAALNKDFARFDAGTHPINTGKPELAGRTRAARLAAALGLDLDPGSTAPRRAVEVYPHAATVALFRLGRTLKYKNKQGRSLVAMRGELLRLVQLLESLDGATPRLDLDADAWRALVRSAEQAASKADLRRVEDQVDAVVCAYVAAYAVARPDDVTAYGDAEHGTIVTPSLPADHAPDKRPARAPARDRVVDRAVRRYAAAHAELSRAGTAYVDLVRGILDDAGINYLSVTGRTKAVDSFAEKATRSRDGIPLYPDPLADIADVIGVRVITYLHSDVAAVADLLAAEVEVLDDRDMGRETAREGRWGYASRHLQIALDPADQRGPIGGRQAQVQIRTVLQHAWAEFEHAIRYKGTVPEEHARELDRRFTLAAGLLELADREFTGIRDQLEAELAAGAEADAEAAGEDHGERIDDRELAAFLAGQYAGAGWSRPDHYAWIASLLPPLGITSLPELAEALTAVDEEALVAAMGYRYPAGAVRRLDDALLARFGDHRVDLPGNAHRTDLLRTRLAKIA